MISIVSLSAVAGLLYEIPSWVFDPELYAGAETENRAALGNVVLGD